MSLVAGLSIAFCTVERAALADNFTVGNQPAVKFGVHEIELKGQVTAGNPFDAAVLVTFTPPSGQQQAKRVYAFYDGDNTWRARVYVHEAGQWSWAVTCERDPQLHGKSGLFTAADSQLRGRLLAHSKNPRQWMTEDGRWFLNLNDTAYFLLCPYDALGQPIADDTARQYVRDAVDRGLTSFRSFPVLGPAGFLEEGGEYRRRWRDAYFADDALSQMNVRHFQVTDRRLRMLLDEFPDVYLQFILFPMGCRWGRDQEAWQTFTPQQKERVMRYMIARFAAFPQLFWLVVNDAHYGPSFPGNNAYAREAGEYFKQHDPWQHPFSTGHARTVPFFFPDEKWASYIHLEHAHDLAAAQAARYQQYGKPIFLGEDRYEQDHGARLDPTHMDYWQRRLFWSWLLAGGSANYGGRWWSIHPYTQTGNLPTFRPTKRDLPFTAQLTGLDSVRHIRDYFASRKLELSDFEPDQRLAADMNSQAEKRQPKVMRRNHEEYLVYHPNATADDQQAQVHASRAAALWLDLREAARPFTAEWFRADTGEAASAGTIMGGQSLELTAPWTGCDVVLRLVAAK